MGGLCTVEKGGTGEATCGYKEPEQPPKVTVMARQGLPPSAMSGTIILLQTVSVLFPVAHVSGLSCCLRPSSCPKAALMLRANLTGIA